MSAAFEPTPAEATIVRATFFNDRFANTKRETEFTLADLLYVIRTTTARSKEHLPLLKLATFGDVRTIASSLRSNANMVEIFGLEGDYDNEAITVEDAVGRLQDADVRALVYTSPSHVPDKPRWRVLAPLSCGYPANERDKFMGRLSGLFGGQLAAESWTLSQSYYFGWVNNDHHRALIIEGTPIDLRPDLDQGWIGRPGAATGTPAEQGKERPLGDGYGAAPASDERHDAYRRSILDGLRRNAVDGQKHTRLRGAAIAVGKVSEAAGFSDAETVQFLMDALPDTVKDWVLAKSTASWGLAQGRANPASLEDRPNPKARPKPAQPEQETPEEPAPEGTDHGPEAVHEAGDQFAPPPDPGKLLLTEHNVALSFTRRHKDQLRYCHDIGKWYVWTGTHWQQNRTKLAFSWARRLIADLNRNLDFKAKLTTGKAAFAAAVERFAQADGALAVTADIWDRDLFLLGTPGGTVDLRTGELRPARREDYITKLTAVTPAATADCPQWLTFLKQVANDGAGLIRFLQQWFGYSLTGDISEHALIFLFGPGGNGKGVLLGTAANIIGAYNAVAAMETFVASANDHHPTDLAMLRGARMVSVSETEEGRPWAESRIKQLTGGDKISARFMRQDFFEYLPQFKLTIIGNHKPVLRNVDDAARRRFNMVPFLFKPPTKDLHLQDKLKPEWPGILRWMIDGCRDWQANGLMRPDVVQKATASYFEEQDIVHQWVEECCELGARQSDTTAILFKSWTDHALANGEKPGTSNWFAQTLAKLGCEAVGHTPGDPGRRRGFKGISVKRTASAPWTD